MTGEGHYEAELFEPPHIDESAHWRPIMIFPEDSIPVPLTFGSLGEARSYAEREQIGTVRIVWVTEEGERLVVEAPGS